MSVHGPELRPIAWHAAPQVPREAAAVLDALRFHSPSTDLLRDLSEDGWKRTLKFCDETQLTLLLRRWAGILPEPVCQRLGGNTDRRRLHRERLFQAASEIAGHFDRAGIPFVVIKGFSHGREYAAEPELRPQYDLDIWGPMQFLPAARDILIALGYQPLIAMKHFPTDHLPAMVRKTGYEWSGDFFDPAIPPSVDLHFRLWDPETERFAAPGLDQFWDRRVPRSAASAFPALHPVDELGAAALHLIRHLLRGSLRPYHVHEIAYFLEHTADDDPFWQSWRGLHPPALRQIQVIAFLLARRWFGPRLSAAVQEEVEQSHPDIRTWMEQYGHAPVSCLFHPNKSELWLHLALLPAIADRARVFRRRVVPLRAPGPVAAVFVPRDQLTLATRVRSAVKYSQFVARRAAHHIRSLAPVASDGVRWAFRDSALDSRFAWFLAGANLYSLGIFIFVLLYNLYLLDVGFKEDVLGRITGAMTAGTVAACIPASKLVGRFGIRFGLLAAALLVPVLSAIRLLAHSEAALVATAFLAGSATSFWFVSSTPAVAQLASERRRPLAFSLWIGTGIATGILGGILGSRLPGWLSDSGLAHAGAGAKQGVLMIGCAAAMLSALLLRKLRFSSEVPMSSTVIPSGSFVWRFVGAAGVWYFALGAFNPFFNAFFARQQTASLEQIGSIFAASQFVQAIAVFLAPFVVRRFGLAGAITTTQIFTAAMLAGLAIAPSTAGPALYIAYMSFQVMSEPGIFSLLMNKVKREEQTAASGLNFVTMFSTHAAAAVLGGWLASVAGYPALLLSASAIAALSALLIHLLFKPAVFRESNPHPLVAVPTKASKMH